MKYLSIAFFVAAPLFLVWSIGFWENQISYFIFVFLLLMGVIFATRKPKNQSYDINPDDPDYQRRREEASASSQNPIALIMSPVLWFGLFFIGLVLYILVKRLFF